MKILDQYKGRYLVEHQLPKKSVFEVYDITSKVFSGTNFDMAVKKWSELIACVG